MATARPAAGARAVTLPALLLLSLAARAAGHAVMIDPPSRPWLDYLEK